MSLKDTSCVTSPHPNKSLLFLGFFQFLHSFSLGRLSYAVEIIWLTFVHIHKVKIDSHSKFSLDVKTDDDTHRSQGYEKVYYSHHEAFWGEQGRLPNLVQKWLEKAGKRDWLGVLLWLGGGAGVRAGVCMV